MITQEYAHIVASRGFVRSGTGGTYWAALATNAAGELHEFATMADVAELAADGYARVALANWGIYGFLTAVTMPPFVNGGEEPWPAVTHLVIVYVAGEAECVAWFQELPSYPVAEPGDTIQLQGPIGFLLVSK